MWNENSIIGYFLLQNWVAEQIKINFVFMHSMVNTLRELEKNNRFNSIVLYGNLFIDLPNIGPTLEIKKKPDSGKSKIKEVKTWTAISDACNLLHIKCIDHLMALLKLVFFYIGSGRYVDKAIYMVMCLIFHWLISL